MISISYEGNNNTIDLVGTPNLIMTGYDGLDQPISETITLSNPNLRGTQYQRSQISDRLISFTFEVFDVENIRYKLMNVFKSGEKGTLIVKNDFREGKIECVFEEMTFNKWVLPTTCTIFLKATDPYFKGMKEIVTELDNSLELFVLEAYIPEEGIVFGELSEEHSMELVNESDIDVGVKIEIIAHDTVTNPKIYNETTNQFIGLNGTMNAGEKLVITTGTGNKRVLIESGGISTNNINRLAKGSTFFQLKRGTNKLRSEASSGANNMTVYVSYNNEFEAV